jgi:adenylate kinase family enzyme
MNKKIYISGVSGTGKSTLAKHFAEVFKIPFVETSTKPLWPKYGIKSHQELIQKATIDPVFGIDFQFELLEFREQMLKDHENFITDRSPIDNLVYFLGQNSAFATETQTEEYVIRCTKLLDQGSHCIFLKFTPDIPLENDGMRVVNRYYQIYSDNVFEHVLQMYFAKTWSDTHTNKILKIAGWNWGKRVEAVSQYISTLILRG